MKPRTPGFWLIAISLGIMPLKILGQSFWDAPGNGLLNALGGLPPSNPKWWEDKEHMQILRDTYEKQDRERRDAYEKQAREQRITLAEEDADAWVREHPETAEKTATFKRRLKAAAQGDANAQLRVGYCYYTSLGVAKNNARAVDWFRVSATQGLSIAQINLGTCYYAGTGVSKNDADAFRWFLAAAEQENTHAQNRVGLFYYLGEGAPQNEFRAVYWWSKAAEQGDSLAQLRLGGCYFSGRGVGQDYVRALKWYILAAEQGDPAAQVAAGNHYVHGLGVAKDEVEAYAYYSLVAVPSEFAKKELTELEKGMTHDARLRGQQRAKELQKEIEAKKARK
jgi:TPR repeat protein